MISLDTDGLADLIADRVAERLAPEPVFLSADQLATRVGLGVATVRKLSRRGDIPTIMIGRRRLFDLQRVREALADGLTT